MTASSRQIEPLPMAVLAGLVAAALAFIHFVHFSRESLLAQDLQNFGHVIVFAIVAVAVHAGVRRLRGHVHDGMRSYWLSGVTLVALGFASEALQMSTGRNADLGDFLRNCVGAYVGLAGSAVFARPPEATAKARRRISTGVVLATALALVLLAVTLVPVAKGFAASLKRNNSFPDLLPKSALFFNRYVNADSVLWMDDSNGPPSSPYIRCVLTDRLFPGVILVDPVSDWQHYRHLCLHYRLTGPEAQGFFLLVDICDDAGGDLLYRYELPLEAGEHELRVDLASAQDSANGWAPIRCVDRLYIKTVDVDSSLILDLYGLYLEL